MKKLMLLGLAFSLTDYGLTPWRRSKLDLGFELSSISWSYSGEELAKPDFGISLSLSYKFGS